MPLFKRQNRRGDTAHVVGMGGSRIAMPTACYVDNGKRPPIWDRLPTAAYRLLPALAGGAVVVRAVRRATLRR